MVVDTKYKERYPNQGSALLISNDQERNSVN